MIPVLAILSVLCLSGCGKLEPKVTIVSMTPSLEETVEPAALKGGWYGYWSVSDGSGNWKRIEGKCYDCCAKVLHEESGLVLLLWDEDMPMDNYLAKLKFKETEGRYRCTGGDFLGVAAVPEDIQLQLRSREGTVLQIGGICDDPVTSCFSYIVFLRPWGDPWPDTGRRPVYYESWYLPKIEAGDSMPDHIDVK